jgi:calmodulin
MSDRASTPAAPVRTSPPPMQPQPPASSSRGAFGAASRPTLQVPASATRAPSSSSSPSSDLIQRTVLTAAITDAERAEFREMFNFARRQGNAKDTRDREELRYMMETLRLNPSKAELDAMMKEVDTDGSGDVDFDEFVDVMSRTTPFAIPATKVRAAMRFFGDEHREGFCATDVLRDAIAYHCADELREEGLDEDYVDYLLSRLDPGATGAIKAEDLLSVIEASEKAVAGLAAAANGGDAGHGAAAGKDDAGEGGAG